MTAYIYSLARTRQTDKLSSTHSGR